MIVISTRFDCTHENSMLLMAPKTLLVWQFVQYNSVSIFFKKIADKNLHDFYSKSTKRFNLKYG